MSSLKNKKQGAEDYIRTKESFLFSSPASLGLLNTVPFAKNPIDAVLWYAEMLVIESGLTEPPFSPSIYAPIRKIKEVLYKDIKVDGRLIPYDDGFKIELRQDRPHRRKNFTFAHELAHTFFHEAIPSIKYRTITNNYPEYDEEEEKLCDIAASELLMPSSVISTIAKDYSPSPQSLKQISQIFDTSLMATIIKLLSLKIWNANFILWKIKNREIKAEWLAMPNRGFLYSPEFELVNYKTTSIYHTFTTGEATTNQEWFSLNRSFKQSRFQSIRLNSKTVLTCFTNDSTIKSYATIKSESPLQNLPLKYDCKCGGTGWCYNKQNGITHVTRCLATEHKGILAID